MEIEITRKERVTVDRLRAECGVRYWEDAEVNGVEDSDGALIPLRVGDEWVPTIMLETGQILEWPQGTTAKLHYKVCDEGIYSLLSPYGDVVAKKGGYVPDMLSPAEPGYGDYIIMNIGPDGVIEDWRAHLDYFEDDE